MKKESFLKRAYFKRKGNIANTKTFFKGNEKNIKNQKAKIKKEVFPLCGKGYS
ncbi:MAG: hypothetical protein JW928_07275 [Candidatus Aureabacteria bacterium]|nr:hypothetical protein [Candidatus Auribacterota bacterium]